MPGDDEQVIEQSTDKQPGGGKEKQPETTTIPKADWERVQRENAELRESERFWSDEARRQRGKFEEPEEEEEEIDVKGLIPGGTTGNDELDEAIFNDPDKWTDAVSKGPEAIGRYIKKLNIPDRLEVAQIAAKAAKQAVDVATRKYTTDAELMRDFPELKDNKSELWKETAVRLNKAIARNPASKNDPNTIFLAAEAAREYLKAKNPPAGRDRNGRFASDDDTYDRYGEDEDERRARVDAQGGSRSRRGGEPDEDQDMLGPVQKQICKDMGVSEADFIKSRRELAGGRGRRR